MLILSVATRLTRRASPKPELLGLGLNFYNPKEFTTRLARTRLTRNPSRAGPKPGGLARLTSLLTGIKSTSLCIENLHYTPKIVHYIRKFTRCHSRKKKGKMTSTLQTVGRTLNTICELVGTTNFRQKHDYKKNAY